MNKIIIYLISLLFLLCSPISECLADHSIDSLNSEIRKQGARWIAGETSISILPESEKIKRFGLNKLPELDLEELSDEELLIGEVPTSLDWRNKNGYNYLTSIKDQNGCGSCWAFSSVAQLESHVMIRENKPGLDIDLSEQVLISCSGAGSCNGGYPNGASNYIRTYGLPSEMCFPYMAINSNCSNACPSYKTITYRINEWSYVTSSVIDIEKIKSALINYGPIQTTMTVYSDFLNYKTGIYSYIMGQPLGYHAILIIGYDDLNQCFIAKNSWGYDWGEEGYFKIAYSQSKNGVKFGGYTIVYKTNYIPPPQPNCTYSLNPTHLYIRKTGGSGTISITTQMDCVWFAWPSHDWIKILNNTGTGSGKLNYIIDPYSEWFRTGYIYINNKKVIVSQIPY